MFQMCYTRAQADYYKNEPGYGFTYVTETLSEQSLVIRKVLPLVSCVNTTLDEHHFFSIIPSEDNCLSIINGIGTFDGKRRTPFIHAYFLDAQQRNDALILRKEYFKSSLCQFIEKYVGNYDDTKKYIQKYESSKIKITDFISENIFAGDILNELGIELKSFRKLIISLFAVKNGNKNQVVWINDSIKTTKDFIKYGKKILALLYSVLPMAESFQLGTVITNTEVLRIRPDKSDWKLYYRCYDDDKSLFPGTNLYILDRRPAQNEIDDNSIVFINGYSENFNPDTESFTFLNTIIDYIKNEKINSLFEIYDEIEDIVLKINAQYPDLQDMEIWEKIINQNDFNWLKGITRSELLYFLDIILLFIDSNNKKLVTKAKNASNAIYNYIDSFMDNIFIKLNKKSKAQNLVNDILLKIIELCKRLKHNYFDGGNTLKNDIWAELIANNICENLYEDKIFKALSSSEYFKNDFNNRIKEIFEKKTEILDIKLLKILIELSSPIDTKKLVNENFDVIPDDYINRACELYLKSSFCKEDEEEKFLINMFKRICSCGEIMNNSLISEFRKRDIYKRIMGDEDIWADSNLIINLLTLCIGDCQKTDDIKQTYYYNFIYTFAKHYADNEDYIFDSSIVEKVLIFITDLYEANISLKKDLILRCFANFFCQCYMEKKTLSNKSVIIISLKRNDLYKSFLELISKFDEKYFGCYIVIFGIANEQKLDTFNDIKKNVDLYGNLYFYLTLRNANSKISVVLSNYREKIIRALYMIEKRKNGSIDSQCDFSKYRLKINTKTIIISASENVADDKLFDLFKNQDNYEILKTLFENCLWDNDADNCFKCVIFSIFEKNLRTEYIKEMLYTLNKIGNSKEYFNRIILFVEEYCTHKEKNYIIDEIYRLLPSLSITSLTDDDKKTIANRESLFIIDTETKEYIYFGWGRLRWCTNCVSVREIKDNNIKICPECKGKCNYGGLDDSEWKFFSKYSIYILSHNDKYINKFTDILKKNSCFNAKYDKPIKTVYTYAFEKNRVNVCFLPCDIYSKKYYEKLNNCADANFLFIQDNVADDKFPISTTQHYNSLKVIIIDDTNKVKKEGNKIFLTANYFNEEKIHETFTALIKNAYSLIDAKVTLDEYNAPNTV